MASVPAADGRHLANASVPPTRWSVGPAGRGGTARISSSGLIVTNHHVALDAIRRASTSGKDV